MAGITRRETASRISHDSDAGAPRTIAGAAARASQRLLSAEAARRPDWARVAVDVEEAFVRGARGRKEMREFVGEAPWKVNFALPLGNATVLRQMKGRSPRALHEAGPREGGQTRARGAAPRGGSRELARGRRQRSRRASSRGLAMMLSGRIDDIEIAVLEK